ncbi:hypothetical protein B8V81_2725 [Paenibacillus pasadenensis]|uniref:Uncharacterized protein n=2 Tax=Paenibacillus TaxID=44249 RepID=A0A2N5N1S4_9BACL|nr:hypothetical protein B8V81_2725 [Paenibacillus pasadenensis]
MDIEKSQTNEVKWKEMKELMHMSRAVFDYAQEQIEMAYHEQNPVLLEKETDYVFTKLLASLSTLFPEQLVGISIKPFLFSTSHLFSSTHKNKLFKWLDRLYQLDLPASDMDFGKLKIDFELWYYELGGDFIEFSYQKSYLMKPSEAAEALGISTVTLHKYIKQGLECLDNGSQNKIPKHAVELLKDPVYGVLMQLIGQKKKRLHQKPAERLGEIYKEIAEYQIRYGAATVHEAFAEYDGDEMDDPTDYYRWKDLTEEITEILKDTGGGK